MAWCLWLTSCTIFPSFPIATLVRCTIDLSASSRLIAIILASDRGPRNDG